MPKQSTTQLMEDPRELMRRALSSKEGISIEFESHERASDYRQRCYSIRQMDRDAAKRIHEPGTNEYGSSEFDLLVFQLYIPEREAQKESIKSQKLYFPRHLKISCAGAIAFGMKAIKDLATGRAI